MLRGEIFKAPPESFSGHRAIIKAEEGHPLPPALNHFLDQSEDSQLPLLHSKALTHLDVQAELLQAFEERLFVARHKRLHVGVDFWAHLGRLLLDLQLNTERRERESRLSEKR